MQEIQAIFDYYKEKNGNQEELIACLREIQAVLGCIPKEFQQKIAELFGVKVTVVQAYIKLYPSLKEQASKHIITVCNGPRCGNKGAQRLLRELKQLPGVQKGEIDVKTQMCMHHCATSPNIKVDGVLLEHARMEEILKRLQ